MVPLFAVALLVVQGLILSYVGDAAIYLNANPRNVSARQEIRAAGIALLQKLHDSSDFDRIILVGHSLGSVIGYDLINHFWQRYHDRHGDVDRPEHTKLRHFEGCLRAKQELDSGQWQNTVGALWHEQRGLGIPWLITDFVTMGSPLAHATLLLARDQTEFDRKLAERELPVAPPKSEAKGSISYSVAYKTTAGAERNISVLHHGAPFAVVRWTNLYCQRRSKSRVAKPGHFAAWA